VARGIGAFDNPGIFNKLDSRGHFQEAALEYTIDSLSFIRASDREPVAIFVSGVSLLKSIAESPVEREQKPNPLPRQYAVWEDHFQWTVSSQSSVRDNHPCSTRQIRTLSPRRKHGKNEPARVSYRCRA